MIHVRPFFSRRYRLRAIDEFDEPQGVGGDLRDRHEVLGWQG